jgi:exonuclease SbcC
MINKLEIQNYESHKHTILEFVPDINIIVGQTDSGKSAIRRSLNWIINNKPAGDSFRTYDSDNTTIILNDNIKRIKGKENKYIFNNQEYKAFGQNVPEVIKKELNFSDINIQKQLDTPFLLSNSAGDVAKYLNKIVNLDIIDTTLSKIEQKKRYHKNKIEYLKNDLEKHNNQLDEYNNLDNLEKKLEELEYVQIEERNFRNEYSKMKILLGKYKNLLTKANEFIILKEEIKINKNLKIYEEIEKIKLKSKKIFILLEKIKNLNKKLEKIKKEIEKKEELFTTQMPNICPLCGK